MAESGKCEWQPGVRCHFADDSVIPLRKLDGRLVCLAHWPVADGKKTIDWISEYFKSRHKRNAHNLKGFVVPNYGESALPNFEVHEFDLSEAKFLGGIHLMCRSLGANLSDARFDGRTLINGLGGPLNLGNATFATELEIQGQPPASIDLGNALCRGPVTIRIQTGAVGPFEALNFARTTFHHVPRFTPSSLPQQTTFYRAKFKGPSTQAQFEASYRAIRKAFADNSDREMEGFFFTHEKRSHRRSLSWWPSGLARFVSWLYDRTSNYGRRYELALAWLVGIQLAFGIGYSVASDRWNLPGGFDSTIATFTIGQVVRPFEFYSARAPTSSVYRQLFRDVAPGGGWMLATTIHSVVSLTLFALMLLAMRWRFRRE